MNQNSPTKEAFTEPYNLYTLAGLTALSFMLLTPAPLLAALVGEAVYLLFVPDSPWYSAIVNARTQSDNEKASEEKRRRLREGIVPTLDSQASARYKRLLAVRDQITSGTSNNADWYVDLRNKLEEMLDRFLTYAVKEKQFREHLNTLLDQARASNTTPRRTAKRDDYEYTPINASNALKDATGVKAIVSEIVSYYQAECDKISAEANEALSTQSPNSAMLIQKRAEMMTNRIESIKKLGDALIELTHKASLLEDTFGYISDKVNAAAPEDVLTDIDDLVMQTNLTTDTLESLAPYEQLRVGA